MFPTSADTVSIGSTLKFANKNAQSTTTFKNLLDSNVKFVDLLVLHTTGSSSASSSFTTEVTYFASVVAFATTPVRTQAASSTERVRSTTRLVTRNVSSNLHCIRLRLILTSTDATSSTSVRSEISTTARIASIRN